MAKVTLDLSVFPKPVRRFLNVGNRIIAPFKTENDRDPTFAELAKRAADFGINVEGLSDDEATAKVRAFFRDVKNTYGEREITEETETGALETRVNPDYVDSIGPKTVEIWIRLCEASGYDPNQGRGRGKAKPLADIVASVDGDAMEETLAF